MSISNYTQEIYLPSNGYLNPDIPEGKIIQRCMMVSDQKFLSGSSLSPDSTMNELLRRTIDSPDTVDIGSLTMSDTLYLLFKLRVLSYGNQYSFRTRCPECGKKIDIDVDLSQLEVTKLEPDFADHLKIVLPNAGDTVYTKFLTNRDLSEIRTELEKRRKITTEEVDNEFVLRLAAMVKKIELKEKNLDGDKVLEHPVDIQKYIEKLTDLDATAIRSTTESLSYGISPTIERRCPHCREYVDVNMQFGSSFFRPKFNNR